MATETRTTPDAAYAALDEIEKLTAPGQELNIYQAIDLICDVYNACRRARVVTYFNATTGRDVA